VFGSMDVIKSRGSSSFRTILAFILISKAKDSSSVPFSGFFRIIVPF